MKSLKTGRPFWVYYQDIDSGANLAVPQLIRGYENDGYTVVKKNYPNINLLKLTVKLPASSMAVKKMSTSTTGKRAGVKSKISICTST